MKSPEDRIFMFSLIMTLILIGLITFQHYFSSRAHERIEALHTEETLP